MQFPVDAQKIIPHRESMLLLNALLASSSEYMEGRSVVKSDNLFLNRRGLDGVCFVELLAQLAAAGDGYESIKAGKQVRSGFLVGVNDFSVFGTAAAGDELLLKLRKGMELNNFTIVEGDVFRGAELLARGNLKVFVLDNPPGVKNSEDNTQPIGSEYREIPVESVIHEYFSRNSAIKSAENGTVRATTTIQPDFPGFRGHFPGYPIVPGVALLNIPVVLAEKKISCEMTVAAIDRAKFSRQVLPGDIIAAEFTVGRDADQFTLKGNLTVEGKPAAAFTLKTRKSQ